MENAGYNPALLGAAIALGLAGVGTFLWGRNAGSPPQGGLQAVLVGLLAAYSIVLLASLFAIPATVIALLFNDTNVPFNQLMSGTILPMWIAVVWLSIGSTGAALLLIWFNRFRLMGVVLFAVATGFYLASHHAASFGIQLGWGMFGA